MFQTCTVNITFMYACNLLKMSFDSNTLFRQGNLINFITELFSWYTSVTKQTLVVAMEEINNDKYRILKRIHFHGLW